MQVWVHGVSVLLTGGLLALSAPALAESMPAPRTVADDIGALEEQSYAAWKKGDAAVWSSHLSENFVGWGATGRIGKTEAVTALGGARCQIDGYKLSKMQITQLTADAALLTHRTEVEGACDGQALPAVSSTASIYVRESGAWKLAYRAQSEIVDPMKALKPADSDVWESGPTGDDDATQVLLTRETAVVTAWKDHDGARMAKLFGPEVQFIDIFGNHIGSRDEALKAWSGEGCEVSGFTFNGAKATMLGPDFGVLTYRAVYDAKCFGQDVWPIWGTAFYVKHGDDWLWSSGINVIAGAPE